MSKIIQIAISKCHPSEKTKFSELVLYALQDNGSVYEKFDHTDATWVEQEKLSHDSKIVQIVASPCYPSETTYQSEIILYVLCADGSVWGKFQHEILAGATLTWARQDGIGVMKQTEPNRLERRTLDDNKEKLGEETEPVERTIKFSDYDRT